MPLPADDQLDTSINELYDSVLDRAVQPSQFGIVNAKSAGLQAASQRRLVVAIDSATAAQERTALAQEATNRRMERLEWVGIAIAIVGAALGVIQVGLAIWSRP